VCTESIPPAIAACTLTDLVEIGHLQRLLQAFTAATGCASGLVSIPDRELLAAAGPPEVCAKFSLVAPASEEPRLAAGPQSGQEPGGPYRPAIISSEEGVLIGVTPIVIGSEPVAALFVGLALNGEPCHADQQRLSAAASLLSETALTIAHLGSRLLSQRQDDRKFRAIFDEAYQFMGLMTPDGVLIEANRAALSMAGLNRSDVIGRIFWKTPWWAHSRELRHELRAAIEKAAAGELTRFEASHPTPGGGTRYVDVTIKPVKDDEGNVVFLIPEGRDITERRMAEETRLAQLHFLESLEQIDRVIRQTNNMEQMLDGVIRATSTIFDCDRAWLLYPCDPEAPSFRVPMMHTRPEYLIDDSLNLEVPMSPGQRQDCLDALGSEDPVTYTAGTARPVDMETAEEFGVKALMFMAVYPRTGKPWAFGMHQCAYARVWSEDDQRLFKEIGRRIADGLSSMLFFRDLRVSQERLTLALEGANAGLWDFNPQTGQAYYGPGWFTMLGYQPDELPHTYETWTELIHPDDRPAIEAHVRKFIESKEEFYSVEFRMKAKDGSWQWIDSRGRAFERDAEGRVARVAGTHTVITGRKLAEEKLRKSQAALVEGQRIAHFGYWDWDVGTGEVEWSAEVYRIFGLDPEHFQPQIDSILALAPPEERGIGKELIERAILRREPGTFEMSFCRPDGRRGCYESTFEGRYDKEGNLVRLMGVVCDITERRRAEEELRSLRNYLDNIIDSMPSVLVGVDAAGCVTRWNRRAEQETGIEAGAATGRELRDVFPRLSSEMTRIQLAIQERQTQRDAKRPRQTDGGTRYEDVTIYPLVSNGVEGVVLRVDDVTERVRLEEMMIQSEKMLSVGGLAAGMAHEINNPLAGMMQNATVVINRLTEDIPANDRAASECGTHMATIRAYMEKRNIVKQLAMIRESGLRAAEIVKNMLSFARKSDSEALPTDLCELLDNTIGLAENDYDLRKKYDFRRIEIVREYQPDMPPVPCEASKIQQVFLNLLKNGAEAMGEGRRQAEGEDAASGQRFTLRVLRDGDMARVEVEDNGPGIDEETRRRVFEPFFTTKGVGAGTGLGLSVSYFIVTENHRGTMKVESRLGRGTKFIVCLPFARPPAS
jgi:PAS domain S-box-containing protein